MAGTFIHGAANTGKDELPCGTTLTRSCLAQAAMKVARVIETGADCLLHALMLAA